MQSGIYVKLVVLKQMAYLKIRTSWSSNLSDGCSVAYSVTWLIVLSFLPLSSV